MTKPTPTSSPCSTSAVIRKRCTHEEHDLSSFISRSLSCMFTETAKIVNLKHHPSENSNNSSSNNKNLATNTTSTNHQRRSPSKKRRLTSPASLPTQSSSCCFDSSHSTGTATTAITTATATSSSSTNSSSNSSMSIGSGNGNGSSSTTSSQQCNPPLPTTISTHSMMQVSSSCRKHHHNSRSIGKLSKNDSLYSLGIVSSTINSSTASVQEGSADDVATTMTNEKQNGYNAIADATASVLDDDCDSLLYSDDENDGDDDDDNIASGDDASQRTKSQKHRQYAKHQYCWWNTSGEVEMEDDAIFF